MLIKVREIEVLPPYRLRLAFSDGTRGVYDCTLIVARSGPMVLPLRDETYFARVFLEFGAPTWPNGYDMAPWALHKELADAGLLSGGFTRGRTAAE